MVRRGGARTRKRGDVHGQAGETGAFEYEVRVQEAVGEANLQNNRAGFRVAVKKDKVSVLLVEERPRWEYQYWRTEPGQKDQRMKLQTVLLRRRGLRGWGGRRR